MDDEPPTILGRDVRGPVEQLETFAADPRCTQVRFKSTELTSLCPITGQPDFSDVEIVYRPAERCIESKSLKLYLWSFRDRAAFAERIAGEIASEVQRAAAPVWVRVVVHQHVRGGITLEATSELGRILEPG